MKQIRLLKASEIDVKIGSLGQDFGNEVLANVLLYKNSRVDMAILDEVFGVMGWQKHYSNGNRNCTVSLWDDEKKMWIEKEDVGQPTPGPYADKGLASDSFKRACFNIGIGRELYSARNMAFPIRKEYLIPNGRGNYSGIQPGYTLRVYSIEYNEEERTIKHIRIVDSHGTIVISSYPEDYDKMGNRIVYTLADLNNPQAKNKAYPAYQPQSANQMTNNQQNGYGMNVQNRQQVPNGYQPNNAYRQPAQNIQTVQNVQNVQTVQPASNAGKAQNIHNEQNNQTVQNMQGPAQRSNGYAENMQNRNPSGNAGMSPENGDHQPNGFDSPEAYGNFEQNMEF